MQYTIKIGCVSLDIVLDKYWVTHSGYFRLATIVALGMGITYGKLLLCHGISEESGDKNISMKEYNKRTFYDCFNNSFPADYGSPDLNLPPIIIDDISFPHKISRYTPDLLPAAISVASEKDVSTLTTPSVFSDLIPSYDTNTLHVTKKYFPFQSRFSKGYCYRGNGQKKYATKIQGSIAPHALIMAINFIIVFVSLPYLTLPVEIVL